MTKVAALGGELKDKKILNVDFNMHLGSYQNENQKSKTFAQKVE